MVFGSVFENRIDLEIIEICFIYQTPISRLGMSVTTHGGSGRQCVTGSRRNISKYRFVLLNVYRFRET